jgi:hypothetical protein
MELLFRTLQAHVAETPFKGPHLGSDRRPDRRTDSSKRSSGFLSTLQHTERKRFPMKDSKEEAERMRIFEQMKRGGTGSVQNEISWTVFTVRFPKTWDECIHFSREFVFYNRSVLVFVLNIQHIGKLFQVSLADLVIPVSFIMYSFFWRAMIVQSV